MVSKQFSLIEEFKQAQAQMKDQDEQMGWLRSRVEAILKKDNGQMGEEGFYSLNEIQNVME